MCNSPMDFVCECEMAMMKPTIVLILARSDCYIKKKSLTDQPNDPNIISERVDG